MVLWTWHGIWYGVAMFGMVSDMACRAWHGIWHGLARYCMVYDIAGGHDMVYGMARRVMAWYIAWPGRHGMVYDKAWRSMAWYVQMLM